MAFFPGNLPSTLNLGILLLVTAGNIDNISVVNGYQAPLTSYPFRICRLLCHGPARIRGAQIEPHPLFQGLSNTVKVCSSQIIHNSSPPLPNHEPSSIGFVPPRMCLIRSPLRQEPHKFKQRTLLPHFIPPAALSEPERSCCQPILDALSETRR